MIFFLINRSSNDYLNGSLRSVTVYMGILTAIMVVMYIVLAKEYTLTYDVTYEESADLRIKIANKFRLYPDRDDEP